MNAKNLKFNLPDGQSINVEVETTMSIESFLKHLKVREHIAPSKNYEIHGLDGHSIPSITPFDKVKFREMNIVCLDYTNEEIPVPENYEQKCACVLVLDTSYSMDGAPIKELNKGLQTFHSEIKKDFTTSRRLEIEIITFNSKIEVKQKFDLIDNFQMPVLAPRGSTKLVDGVRRAIADIKERKNWYKKTGQTYYRPYIILITDGEPDRGQDIDGLSLEINNGVENRNFSFWPIGVKGANIDVLKKLSCKFPAKMLMDFEFVKLFEWLSMSMSAVSNSKSGDQLDLTPKEKIFIEV